MLGFLLKRAGWGILVLFVATTLVFFLVRLSGDPTYLILPMDASAEAISRFRTHLGLDQPLFVQYINFLADVARGDFGQSYFEQRSVVRIINECLGATFMLAGSAILITVIVAIPLGVISAVRRGSFLDRMSQASALGAYSMPSFWSGILLIQIFGVWLGWLPTFGIGSFKHLILPAINLSFYAASRLSRLTRSSMIEVLKNDYIRTSRAKGLREEVVIYKHALRNALLPIITLLGIEFGILLGGAVMTEIVFAWPGIGWLVIRSISRRDFPVVQGIVLYVAWAFVTINFLVDLSYVFLNPKVRYE